MSKRVWMCGLLCHAGILAVCLLVPALGRSDTNGVVAVLGSWVAKGYNAGGGTVGGSYALGYAGRLAACLAPLGWGVTNLSLSSDGTTNILDTFDTAVLPADPDQVLLGLSLSDEGLAGAPDPAAVSETFRAGLTNLIGRVRANGMYAMTGLCYPHNSYSASEYAYLKAMNLLLNTYDLPSANFLGAVDDGKGHWVQGCNTDSGHPNAYGHKEMFCAIVPSLFDAVRLGKTGRPSPVGEEDGYALITRDAAVHDPIRFVPKDPVHSFTTAFRVRSECTGTVAAVVSEAFPGELRGADRMFVDFGPADESKGHAAPSPDQNGNCWNSWRYSGAVPIGAAVSNLVKTSGATSQVDLVVTAAFDAPNGGSNFGGLMAPDPALLGDLAVTNATEDYFGTGSTAKFKIAGLDRRFSYRLRFFGTRMMDAATRTTRYTVASGNGTFTTNIVTTGTDVGTGGYDGNNDTIVELRGLSANDNGEIEVSVTNVSGYGYLGIMEIRVEEVAPLALADRLLVDFGPADTAYGHAAPSPDPFGHYWNSWRYNGNVPVGASLPGLVRATGAVTPVSLEVTAEFSGPNGGSGFGGLMAPDPALLGDFAVTNATEDYFCTGWASKFKIKGLNNRLVYTLRFFGTRALDGAVRTTRYAADSGNGLTYATNVVTTGTDVGADGYDGNNNTIAELRNVHADANGEIEVGVTMVSGFAYLNIMEIAVVGAVEENDPDSLLIDFGPNDNVNGHAMASPDSNGRYWNNFVPPVNAGAALKNLVDSFSAKTTTVSLVITKEFVSHNGIYNGGLLSPTPALLGYFAQARATEDYFHTQTGGSRLKVSGLNKASVYTLRFFGTRASATVLETRYTAEAGNGTYGTNMVTSGTDVGTDGYDGNNDTIAELTGLVPDASGCIAVGISNVQGTQSYLGIMEIKKERSVAGTGWGTVEFRTNALAYVASTGHEIKVPVVLDGKRWYDVAVAHCYAGQTTRVFVNGTEAGCLPERMAPTAFVLGGEGAATAKRMEGPQAACYQDWCVYRSAWNADEAAAQAAGAMQQASMEICAALADGRFVKGNAVENRAQSLSEAFVNSGFVKQRQKGMAILVR